MLLLLAGCSPEGRTTDPPTRGRPTVESKPLRDAPFCEPDISREPLGRFRLQVWHTSGVDPAAAAEVGMAATTAWTRLGAVVSLTAKGQVEGNRLIMDTPDGPSLQPTKAILAQLPIAKDRHTVHVVAMERFAEAQSTVTTTGVSLRGLTISPRMPTDPNGVLARLNIEGDLTPTVFIDMSAGPRAPGDLSLTPAHEVGHALGLVHRSSKRTLMSEGELSLRCLPGLSKAERTTVARQLGVQ